MMQMSSRLCLLGSLIAMCLLAGCQTAKATDAPTLPGQAVVETMDAGGYTYVKLQSGDGHVWYAVPECEVAVGERVEVESGAMAMHNFKSGTLKRTFPLIYFASGLSKI